MRHEFKRYKGTRTDNGEVISGQINVLARYDKYFIFRTYHRLEDGHIPMYEVIKESIEELSDIDEQYFGIENIEN